MCIYIYIYVLFQCRIILDIFHMLWAQALLANVDQFIAYVRVAASEAMDAEGYGLVLHPAHVEYGSSGNPMPLIPHNLAGLRWTRGLGRWQFL